MQYPLALASILLLNLAVTSLVEILNLKNIKYSIPQEFKKYYNSKEYAKSQRYFKDNTKLGLVRSLISEALFILFILLGGFRLIHSFVLTTIPNEIFQGLVFVGILSILVFITSIPFDIYETFVVEAKYGFNKTTPKLFVSDLIKQTILLAVIGGLIFASLLWIFDKGGPQLWIVAWAFVVIIQLFLLLITPAIIMPLFNKFTPLEKGELYKAIAKYAKKQKFSLSGIFVMDSSKRSTKANAFFVGFGKYRRVVLFDVLIKAHTIDEIVAILAHEIGHYKKKHVVKMVITSFLIIAVVFYLISQNLYNPFVYSLFNDSLRESGNLYAGIIYVSILVSVFYKYIGVVTNYLSRRYEVEADTFAIQTFNHKEDFIDALKKLSVKNLSNLYPHRLKIIFDYSHPPILERIKTIRDL